MFGLCSHRCLMYIALLDQRSHSSADTFVSMAKDKESHAQGRYKGEKGHQSNSWISNSQAPRFPAYGFPPYPPMMPPFVPGTKSADADEKRKSRKSRDSRKSRRKHRSPSAYSSSSSSTSPGYREYKKRKQQEKEEAVLRKKSESLARALQSTFEDALSKRLGAGSSSGGPSSGSGNAADSHLNSVPASKQLPVAGSPSPQGAEGDPDSLSNLQARLLEAELEHKVCFNTLKICDVERALIAACKDRSTATLLTKFIKRHSSEAPCKLVPQRCSLAVRVLMRFK
eukprot:TRINITY_DN32679_c0_g1_i2.p3 TRINITY_DN32679_c0_g1~~TRINITY_DN32679_c0_g1_i2.p3  ORF type:complete len:284 (-),score=18.47 TRINITY_DN32679_c0_g1_i2:1982-2833(-)